MKKNDKGTGWRIPLIFCCLVLVLTLVASLFIEKKPEHPPLPAALETGARALSIDLNTPRLKNWQNAIVEAASGFTPQDQKDRKLAEIIVSALRENLYNVACAAVIHIKNPSLREATLQKILNQSVIDCNSLDWGVFAFYGSKDPAIFMPMRDFLIREWQRCEKSQSHKTTTLKHKSP